jgi:hypothetical protein
MSLKQTTTDTLLDYLAGIRELKSPYIPIGTVLSPDDSTIRQDIEQTINNENTPLVDCSDRSSDLIITEVLSYLQNQKGCVVNVTAQLDQRLFNFFNSLANNQVHITLPGSKVVDMQIKPQGEYIIFLVTEAIYAQSKLDSFSNSTCLITN